METAWRLPGFDAVGFPRGAEMDVPTSGSVSIVGHPLACMSEDRLTRLRRERVAFVFQSFNMVPTLTMRQNAALS